MTDVAMADLSLESPTGQIQSEIAMSLTSEDDTTTANGRPTVQVSKPTPYTFDLGSLLCNDSNPLPPSHTNTDIDAAARDCAQGLINQLLTTCAITSTPDGVSIALPDPNTPLPREKSIPAAKEPTKWELFAKKKGIQAKQREGKKVYNEATGEWENKYGYKGANKSGEDDWLVEVDEKKESATGEAGNVRKERRDERKERIKRQERRERANERKAARK